jgi:serine/threonine-protein kinase
MGPDPGARPATATALVDELERALEPPAPTAPRERPSAATVPLPDRRANGSPRVEPAVAPAAAHRDSSPRRSYGASRSSRRTWLLPLAALLVALAVAGGILLSSSGDEGSNAEGTAAKKADTKSGKKRDNADEPQAAAPASPATSQPSEPDPEPAPAEPSTGTYEVPQPAGDSASQGQRLNAQGKELSDSGDYAAAIPVLERAVRAFPAGTTAESDLNFAFTLFNLGHALNAGGRPADAVPVLEERLKNPNQRGTVQAELDAARAAAGEG